MPQPLTSPLSGQDMDALEAMSKKANAHCRSKGHAPLNLAIDIGDASHRDAYMFICWPAQNSSSTHCARLIFDYIAHVVETEFGAQLVSTMPQETPNGPQR